MKKLLSLYLAAFLVVFTVSLHAETVSNFIFSEDVLNQMKPEQVIRYSHSLVIPENQAKKGFEDAEIQLKLVVKSDDDRPILLSLLQGEKTQNLNALPTAGGNPLVMIFLETTARAMSEIAGGSPFYIRNRIKDTMLHDGERQVTKVLLGATKIDVTKVTLRPFENDPNKARMGAFGNLSLLFSYGADVTAGIHALEADARDTDGTIIYQERNVLQNTNEQN